MLPAYQREGFLLRNRRQLAQWNPSCSMLPETWLSVKHVQPSGFVTGNDHHRYGQFHIVGDFSQFTRFGTGRWRFAAG